MSLDLKQGTTFAVIVTFQDAEGAPVELAGATLQSQIRDSLGNLLAILTASAAPNRPGVVNISYSGSTAAWPVGRYFCDVVMLTADGVTQATQTFGVIVNPSVTQWGSTT
ncbi:hypothetical protein [Acidomonas methanolica]|uniref:Uncharacterized protein n=1 Tax=Acidomonas methanolica NBRC 104435 TaxID=1231351 RepID=A0A023D777_ACIMT|nr:hypothetical protein [Acidomonas methanolica]MBU2653467.1 hypothetical protein [Acidomonas methanolica]TCS32420.1 hypothetical protein EDC31_101361 [Acidomonas methanolica]GAJ30022.1 hypothetical protein Amme_099_007 [Acidomonas methanolica NBRC 104435]GBQ54768.1 hypothetical protein AA0498_2168 [Acidomonas methanolica]GEK97855.1 hypothetical protein AME01nite_03540 [Acidomonas methanolica NBRC 104435]